MLDERNNVKPDRIPRGTSISGLCADCHKSGCPNSKQTSSCQNCHHVHTLIAPTKSSKVDEILQKEAEREQRYAALMREGEQEIRAGHWELARRAFRGALEQIPGDWRAAGKLAICQRALQTEFPGFEIVNATRDQRTGLPREVRIADLGIIMMVVPGGDFEMGSDRFANASLMHTVKVGPFYLGKYELTQAQWKAVMGFNPSAHQGHDFLEPDQFPVDQVSWEDCQILIRKLNERVPGGGFRLPTEAEWEFAAQGGEEYRGTEMSSPRPIRNGKPNRLGLVDMLGNVSEWCSSHCRPYPYSASDGREAADARGYRVLRGGSYADGLIWMHPSARHCDRPDHRFAWNGVRLARAIPTVR